MGCAQRDALAAGLAEGGDIPFDVIRFALCGPSVGGGEGPTGRGRRGPDTIGANRNAILLATLGSLVLCVDDDTVARPAIAPDASAAANTRPTPPHTSQARLAIGSRGELGEVWFFPDRDSALGFVHERDLDILAEHARFLGRSLREIVRECSHTGARDAGVDAHRICQHFVQSLSAGRGRITITLNGLAGDSGTPTNTWVRVCHDERTARHLDSPAAYQAALLSREIVRQVAVPTLSHVRPWLSTFFGVDNRTLLPPFFPAYRNDEAIFGALLSECLEHHYAAHLPWTLDHAPPETRAYGADGDEVSPLSWIRISDVVLVCLESWRRARADGARADEDAEVRQILRGVGRHQVRLLLERRALAILAGLDVRRRRLTAEHRDHWAADLDAQMRALERAIVRPDYLLPVDLLQRHDASDVPHITRDLVRQFGALLSWWPAIVDRTAERAAAGQRLAVPIP
jgi:hypothetical protein